LLGTALAQLILYRSLRYHGAARTSLVTYLMPPIALFYGWLLLDEHLTTATPRRARPHPRRRRPRLGRGRALAARAGRRRAVIDGDGLSPPPRNAG
jgi:hypothetical protein